MTLPAAAFPLRTSGAKILGADGSTVRLAGVNWPGASQDGRVPAGLDKRPRAEIIDWIAGRGFNHVRLPFALGTFVGNDGTLRTGAADPARLAANPDLAGLSPWGVYQALVDDLTVNRVTAGLDPIYVVLNKHLAFPGWCCSQADNNGMWYNDNWPSSTYTNTWLMVAGRFADNPYTGFDLHNEPRPATIGGALRTPAWGTGNGGSFPVDFRQMYQNTAGRIRAAEDGITHLVFCEGLNFAGDLTGWGAHPVTGENIVAEVHDYPWYHRHADGTPQSWAEYSAQNQQRWGYLLSQDTVPVWVGEAGQNTDADPASFANGWASNWLRYMQGLGDKAHWCWWTLNATDVLGTEPSTNAVKVRDGQREGFGLMSGQDWRGSQDDVLDFLAPVMP